jgi:hypothetical protein
MAIPAVSICTLLTRYFLNQQDGGGDYVDPQYRLSDEAMDEWSLQTEI